MERGGEEINVAIREMVIGRIAIAELGGSITNLFFHAVCGLGVDVCATRLSTDRAGAT